MKKFEPKAERVIALIAGESGTGKSYFVGQLKNARIYDTDIGGGLSYLDERIANNGSTRIEVGSYLEIFEDLKRNRRELDGITTLAIDHLTTLHAEAVLRHNPNMAEDFGKSYDKATREWKKLRELVRGGDFNLICTAHLKSKYERQQVVGLTTDGPKNCEADMMIVLYLRKTGLPADATVAKWRRDPEDLRGVLPPSFQFTMAKFLDLHGWPLDGKRQPVDLATAEQVAELTSLLAVVKLPEEGLLEKWLTKAKVDSIEEFSVDQIAACIKFLKALLPKQSESGKKAGAA